MPRKGFELKVLCLDIADSTECGGGHYDGLFPLRLLLISSPPISSTPNSSTSISSTVIYFNKVSNFD